MSDQENSQVKIFFDSNRFPWERQYTDGKGNWYDRDQIDYDEKNNIFYLKKDLIDVNLDYSSQAIDGYLYGDDHHDYMTATVRTPLLLDLSFLRKEYKYKTKLYKRNSLFYFIDKKQFYDPNSNKFYDTIGQSFKLYCYDPIEPGPYDPTSPNRLYRVLSRIRGNNIEIEMKTQNNTSYKLYVFAQFDSSSSFVNC